MLAIAEETGKTAAQVALRWLLQKPGVTAPIIGARTMAHFDDNMGAVGWELTPEQMERLDTVSAKPLPYPYNYLSRL
jgi:aryl-alcohol dehydrogenase-like predicted oxidoreductase